MRGLFFFVSLIAAATGVTAQESFTSITGVVSDLEGGVLPGANVIAIAEAGGAEFHALTEGDGHFRVGPLPPGEYRVEVYAPGFKQFIAGRIAVAGKLQTEIHPKLEAGSILEIGKLSQSINVSAESVLVPTDNPSVVETIGPRYVAELPLNGRSPFVLAELAAGVFTTPYTTDVHSDDNGPESDLVISGASATFLVDGSDNTRSTTGKVAYTPPQDSVKEVVVQTFNVDAAIGHGGPGIVDVITKGGTNILHGLLYEFNQVSALDANTWLNDASGKPKPVTRQNQFGANSAGPVVIPRVFRGTNRLFWYFSYEGIRNSAPQSSSLTVPTAAERTGNFSALLALGTQYQIYNPFTGMLSGSTVTRQPFANNVIPASMISPVAKNILNYYPLPNQAGLPNGQRNFTAGQQDYSSNGVNGRLDYALTARNRISWSVRHDARTGVDSDWFQNAATGRFDQRENWGTTLGDIVTFSPTEILDMRVNATRFVGQQSYGNGAFNFTQLGFPAWLGAASARPDFPVISAAGYTPLGSTSGGAGSLTPEENFQIYAGLTKVLTAHNLRAGVDLRQFRQGSQNYGFSSGEYTFNNAWTNGPTTTAAASPLGQSLAALLLGLPTSGEFDRNAEGTYRQDYVAVYFADDWRARPNLTLTMGLRFDKDFPTTERLNRNVNGFALNAANPIQTAAQAAYAKSPAPQMPAASFATPGGLTYAGPGDRDIYHDQSHIFSPRVGFAWTPIPSQAKMVLRGGFAMFTYPLPISGINQAGLSLVTPITATLNNYVAPYATLTNPFPGGLQQPVPLNETTGLGTRVTFANPKLLNPYTMVWNLDLVRQVSGTMVVEAGYQGNHAVHLMETSQLDSIPLAYLSTTPTRNQAAINLLSTPVANPFRGLFPNSTAALNSATSIALQQLLMPFPEYTGVTETGANDATTYYEMGFVRAEKRFSSGLQFNAVYTHARLMARTVRLNPETALLNMVSPQDYPNRFVASAVYQTPFGKGMLGGWLVSTIFTYQTGAPLNWANVIYLGGPLDLNPHDPRHAFNTAAFDTVSGNQLADNWRTFPQFFSNLRADSIKNDDLAVSKTFKYRERASLVFRFDFYNLFNHPVFAAPGLNPTSEAFGTITSGTANRARVIQLAGRMIW